MTLSWLLLLAAAVCLGTAGALAQREAFNRGRQIEIRGDEISRLNGEVELRDRKLEAEEILLRKVRDQFVRNEHAQ